MPDLFGLHLSRDENEKDEGRYHYRSHFLTMIIAVTQQKALKSCEARKRSRSPSWTELLYKLCVWNKTRAVCFLTLHHIKRWDLLQESHTEHQVATHTAPGLFKLKKSPCRFTIIGTLWSHEPEQIMLDGVSHDDDLLILTKLYQSSWKTWTYTLKNQFWLNKKH